MNVVPGVEHQKVLMALLGPNDEVVYRRQKCHFITTYIKRKHRQMNKKGGECKGTVEMVIKGKKKKYYIGNDGGFLREERASGKC
ncbi:hypothetical protein TNCT_447341 [Trichonephila clavata]|uniref:Uncharacterized protein n=1 Tax=Trichonephila clavata TaxID=2740835 RepID=A0A8X6G052_TRICU|nr:hypothetical protein TNCT_447341 [Trichonephila clavata]